MADFGNFCLEMLKLSFVPIVLLNYKIYRLIKSIRKSPKFYYSIIKPLKLMIKVKRHVKSWAKLRILTILINVVSWYNINNRITRRIVDKAVVAIHALYIFNGLNTNSASLTSVIGDRKRFSNMGSNWEERRVSYCGSMESPAWYQF